MTFRIIASRGVGIVSSMKNGRHLVHGSNNPLRTDTTREKALSVADKILNNCVYIEKHPDVKHGTHTRYIEMFAAVKDGNKVVRFCVVAKEAKPNSGEFEIGTARFYDMLKEGKLPRYDLMGHNLIGSSPLGISVADLLTGVKDRQGNFYVNRDGSLNYDMRIIQNGMKRRTCSRHPLSTDAGE